MKSCTRTMAIIVIWFFFTCDFISAACENCPHDLGASVNASATLIDVVDGGYVYCVEVSASCNQPPSNAEMTPGELTWGLSCGSGSSNTPELAFVTTVSSTQELTATVNVSCTVTEEKDGETISHSYTGAGTCTVTLNVGGGNVTPQPCPDSCDYEYECEECSGNVCHSPYPFTARKWFDLSS